MHTRFSLLVVASAVVVSAPFTILTVAGMAWEPPPQRPAGAQKIAAEVERLATSGRDVRVIVNLDVDWQLESEMSPGAAWQQRKTISELQDSLQTAIRPFESQVLRRFVVFPQIALRINERAMNALARHPAVSYVSLDARARPNSHLNTYGSGLIDQNEYVRATEANIEIGLDGHGTQIAIIDDGFRRINPAGSAESVTDHPAIADRIVMEACFNSGNTGCDNGSNTNLGPGSSAVKFADGTYSHGIAVAGAAAGRGSHGGRSVNGVAPGAQLIVARTAPVNAGSLGGQASESDFIAALEWIASIGGNFTATVGTTTHTTIAAVNISYEFPDLSDDCNGAAWSYALYRMGREDIPVIASAGNDGLSSLRKRPVCLSAVYDVGGVSTNPLNAVHPSSNRVAGMDFLAPYTAFTSRLNAAGAPTYEETVGTSFSAPMVAGALAALRQAKPLASSLELITRLKSDGVSVPIDGVNSPRIDLYTSGANFIAPVKTPRRLVGDVDGDGMAEAVQFVPRGRWIVSDSVGDSFTGQDQWIEEFGADSDRQFIADVNGDGKDDAIASWDNQDVKVALSNGDSFAAPVTWRTVQSPGARQLVKDVTGDGKADLVTVITGSDPGWYVGVSTGTGFASPNVNWSDDVQGSEWLVADVDGDGDSDAVSFSKSTGQWLVRRSTGTAFGPATPWRSGYGAGSRSQFLGDINGDGRADAVVYRDDDSGHSTWSYALSSGADFGIPGVLASDFAIGFQDHFLRDVDGDGKDDAIAYSITPQQWSVFPTVDLPPAGSFNPEFVDGCRLWLDAMEASGDLNGQVRGWSDKCFAADGRQGFSATLDRSPSLLLNAINGRPVLRFSNDSMTTASSPFNFAHGDPTTVFVVSKAGPAAGTQVLIADSWGSAIERGFLFYLNNGQAIYRVDHVDHVSGSATAVSAANNQVSTAVMQLGASSPGALSRRLSLRVNDGATAASTVFTPSTGDSQSPLTLGNDSQNGGFFWGDIAEIVVYNRYLSPGEVDAVNDYLATKWQDETAPNTVIDSGPAEGSTVSGSAVVFAFSSSEADSTFECRLSSQSGWGAWQSCSSPRDFSDLPAGNTAFEVRATDLSGNVEPSPARRDFIVEFEPQQLTSCALWLDATKISGVNSGSPVTTWTDNCGQAQNFTVPSGALAPALAIGVNGKKVVRFSGAQKMTTPSSPFNFAHSDKATVFIAAKIGASTGAQALIADSWGSQVQRGFIYYVSGNTAIYRVDYGSGSAFATGIVDPAEMSTAVMQLWPTSTGATSRKLSLQVAIGTTSESTSSFTPATGVAQSPLTIGNDSVGYLYFGGDIGEVVIYDRNLSPGEVAQVKNYLDAKWTGSQP